MLHPADSPSPRLLRRWKAAGYGARAGQVIAGNLARGNDGKFTSAGTTTTTTDNAPAKPPRRSANAAARRERQSQEAETRAAEDAEEQAARDEEDAKLDAAKTPRERNRIRQGNARARRDRARARRAARAERAAAERAARTQEDQAADAEPAPPKPPKPRKGGGGGKGGSDPAKDAAREQERARREAERQARQAAADRRRADADARRAMRDEAAAARRAEIDARRQAAEDRRQQREQQAAEREQRVLTDLAQRASTPGERLSDAEWQRLIVGGLAERGGEALRLTAAGRQQAARPPQGAKAFAVFKDARGEDRWVAVSSTAFRDRDREIVSTKALAEDCAHADATGDYGPLRWWHCPGVDIGDCDFNAVSGRSLIEMGTFRSPALARAAAASAPDLELSIGFTHLPDEPGAGGTYTFIRRFERSLVPRGRAANPYTAFAVTAKEERMTPEKLKAALEKLGTSPEARALMQEIISAAQSREKEAEAAGVAFKEADAMPPAEMIEAGATELADGEAEEGEAPEMLLSEAEIAAIADRVAAALLGQLDGIAAKMASVDEELKGRGYQKMKEATEGLPAALGALATSVKAIQATVDELAGLAPAKGFRPSEDNPDLEALVEAALKGDGGDAIDPNDPLAAVMSFLRPAA